MTDLIADAKCWDEMVSSADIAHPKNDHQVRMRRGILWAEKERRAALVRAEEAEGKLCRAREAFTHIAEYWNRSENDMAMNDALYHMIETAEETFPTLSPCRHAAIAERVENTEGMAKAMYVEQERISDEEGAISHIEVNLMVAHAVRAWLRGEG